MSECGCKIVYKASDGKEFPTMEECKVYENRPKLYAIESKFERYAGGIDTKIEIVNNQTYIDKEVALKTLDELQALADSKRLSNRGYIKELSYRLITLEVDIRISKTIHSKVTHTEPVPEKSWVKEAWSNLWKYRGDK